MDRITFFKFYWTTIIDWIARHVEKPAEHSFSNWDRDWPASIGDTHPALQTFGRRHGDGADPVFTEVLLDFEGELGRVPVDFVFELERVVDARQLPGILKFHVHHGTDDLNDLSFIHKFVQPLTAICA